jgi:mannose-6-phosphate isomerase class I
MAYVLRLVPELHNKVWGGRRLVEDFGGCGAREVPEGPLGECWSVSGHPAGESLVVAGAAGEAPFGEASLAVYWREHPELFGRAAGAGAGRSVAGAAGAMAATVAAAASEEPFPLLVKLLDDLSIQVHPNDAYAAAHEAGALGKRECWYVLDAKPGATIVVGQTASSREEFAERAAAGAWDTLVNELPVAKGDFFQIEPGCVHAIKAGTVIAEVQQSSDITYRVYDYDRPGEDGLPRATHLAQALDVIDYALPAAAGPDAVEVVSPGHTHLVTTPNYHVELLEVDGAFAYTSDDPYLLVLVAEGEVALTLESAEKGREQAELLVKGESAVVTNGFGAVTFTGTGTVLLAAPPASGAA